MTISKKRVFPLALALGAVGVMVMASIATASHPRPSYAGKVTTNLVPAFDECTVATPPNRTHGPPLGGASCFPPLKTSDALQVGGLMSGAFKIAVIEGAVGLPEDSDVKLTVDISDVRCDDDGNLDSFACFDANTAGGLDYTGYVVGRATFRITDHWNGTGPSGGTDAATVRDDEVVEFAMGPCLDSPGDPTIGSACGAVTSRNALVGGPDPATKDGKREVIEVSQLEIFDAGEDGLGTPPTERFLVQGIFIP